MNTQHITGMIVGFFGIALAFIFGAVLADPVITTLTVALTNASIGSYAGAESVGGLIPLVYFTIVILAGLGSLTLVAVSGRNIAFGGGNPL